MPVRAKETSKPQAMIGCGNHSFGCGKQCRILKVDPVSHCVISAEGYHAGVRLCLGCANSAAYNWKIPFDDLDYLMVALLNARAGKCGVDPARDEVWELLGRMNVKTTHRVQGGQSKQMALPAGDFMP